MSGIFDMMDQNSENNGGAKPAEIAEPQLETRRCIEVQEQAREEQEQDDQAMRNDIRDAIQAEMTRSAEQKDGKEIAFGTRLESEKSKKEKENERKAQEMDAERRYYSEAYYKSKAEAARKEKEEKDRVWREEHLYGHKPAKK